MDLLRTCCRTAAIGACIFVLSACTAHGLYPSGDAGPARVELRDYGPDRHRRNDGSSRPDRGGPRAVADAALDMPDAAIDLPDAAVEMPDEGLSEPPVFAPLPSNVLLLIDRSESMNTPLPCAEPPCRTRWEALASVVDTLERASSFANLGLGYFPAPGRECRTFGAIDVRPGDEEAFDDIRSSMSTVSAGGGDPLAAVIDMVIDDGVLDLPHRNNVLLLVTDGGSSCGCDEDLEPGCERALILEAAERLAENESFDTRIIGIGEDASADETGLSAIAEVIGTEVLGVTTPRGLIDALERTLASASPCTYLADRPFVPADLQVRLDNRELDRCDSGPCDEGYWVEAAEMSVQFGTGVCARLRDGEPHQLEFEYEGLISNP